jgi:hypothetical protein
MRNTRVRDPQKLLMFEMNEVSDEANEPRFM